MRYTFYFLLASLCLFSSCKLNPNLQGRGEAFLQGEWVEDSVLYQDELLEYSKHNLTFSCDSFYASIKTYAKVNRYTEDCFNNGNWTEYVKGNYLVRNDTLFLAGTFTKSNFKQKLSGCYRVGQYLPVFLIKNRTDSSVQLQNLQQHLPITLKLKRRIPCNPKPL
jgi:hypothetical protein